MYIYIYDINRHDHLQKIILNNQILPRLAQQFVSTAIKSFICYDYLQYDKHITHV